MADATAPNSPPLRVRQVEPESQDLGSFEGALVRIGKAPECEVRFSGVLGISRIHAVLEWSAGKLWISDPGARHPVEVDGAVIPYQKPTELPSGARVRLGRVLLAVDYHQP